MNKLSLVKTFGGAVTYLSDEYEDFNISSHRKRDPKAYQGRSK